MTNIKTKLPKLPAAWIIPVILTLWAFAPELRRLVDWQVGFSRISVITLIPIAAMVPLFLYVFRKRANPMPPSLAVLAAAWIVGFGFALLITFFAGGMLSGLYQATQFVVPMFIALVVLGRNQPTKTFGTVATTLGVLGGIVAIYGIYQYISPPIWDVLWVQNSRLASVGVAEPFGLRVFSTLNSPGVAGDFFAIAFLCQLPYYRGRSLLWRLPATALIVIGLLLTTDRSAWFATALGFIVYVLLSPRRAGALALMAVVLIGATYAVATGARSIPALQTVQDRFSTFEDVSSDDSFIQRQQEAREALATSLSEPIGQGLGAVGTSTKLAAANGTTSLDNGYLSRFLEMGVFGFAAYLFAVFGAALMTLVRTIQARAESPEAVAVAATCLAIQTGLLLLDISSDHHQAFVGTMFWLTVTVPLIMVPKAVARKVWRGTGDLQFAR